MILFLLSHFKRLHVILAYCLAKKLTLEVSVQAYISLTSVSMVRNGIERKVT